MRKAAFDAVLFAQAVKPNRFVATCGHTLCETQGSQGKSSTKAKPGWLARLLSFITLWGLTWF